MILPLAGLLIGAALGAFRARSHGGNGRDMAQWATAMGILGAIVGLFVLILVSRGA